MPLVETGKIMQAHDFAFAEDAIFCAKKIASEMLDKGANDACVLLNLDEVFVEVNPFSNEDGLLDAWRRARVTGEYTSVLATSFGFPKFVVSASKAPAEPLRYSPPSGASRAALARWRRTFASEIYVNLRDSTDPDAEPYVGWPAPETFSRGSLLPPGEKGTSTMDATYHLIIFWAKLVQKMINEGVSFEEAALKGAIQTHLLEVSLHEARSILRLIKIHLSEAWPHAQSLYDWYDSWVDSEFPQEVPPGIPEWLR